MTTARSLRRRLDKLEQANPVVLTRHLCLLYAWAEPPPSQAEVDAELLRVCPAGCQPYRAHPGAGRAYHVLPWMHYDGNDAPPRFARDDEHQGPADLSLYGKRE